MTQRLFSKAVGMFLAFLLLVPASRAEVMLDATVASDYIFRGINMYNNYTPVFTPSITWIKGQSGLEVSVWGYVAMTNRINSWIADADEVDATVSYVRGFGEWQGRAGLFHLSLPRLDGWPDDATTVNELFVELGRPDWPGMPVASISYELDKWDNHDTYLQLRLGHEIPMQGGMLLFLGSSVGFWSYGYDSVPNFTGKAFTWTRRERVTDINLEVATTVPLGAYALSSKIVMTLSPDEVINADQMVVWSTLTITRAYPGMNR
ncbi:MAG: hypothetical protein V2A56_01880 [bacterium]